MQFYLILFKTKNYIFYLQSIAKIGFALDTHYTNSFYKQEWSDFQDDKKEFSCEIALN